MVIARQTFTLKEYLALETDPDIRYEIVDGELMEMPPESDRNNLVSLYLLAEFLKLVPLRLIRHKDTELVVTGNRTRIRLPDLMILTEELLMILNDQRATITADMPSPQLVVEVVSPGKVNEDRDYRYKRSEYAARGIPEYWIVDPSRARVMILTLVDGLYEEVIFTGRDQVISAVLPGFSASVEQVLQVEGSHS